MRKHGPSNYDYASLLKRLFKHRVIDPVTECWIWPRLNTAGYPQLFFEHRGQKYCVRLHRLMAWLYLGYDGRADLQVCHRCNVKACFNPTHLYLGSHQQNISDALRDGLIVGHKKGSEHYEARFTEERVREIRMRVAAGETYYALSKEYGVHRSTIRRLVLGKTWKHVGQETIQ